MERKKGQRYSNEFRREAVERMRGCDNVVRLARELGICRRVLYNWRDRLDETNPPPARSHELILRSEYLQKLREQGMLPSMSRPANPYDNATCESFLKTLKREEIYASTCRDFEDLQERTEEFVERYYNECRLHSALGYCSPEKFEKESRAESERASAAAVMTFFG